MLIEKSGGADWKHLIASQMLAQAVPFCTNPSVAWALGMPKLVPAQPRDGQSHIHLLTYHFRTTRVAEAWLPSLNAERAEGTSLGLSATAKALVKCRGRRTSSRLPDSAPQGRGSVAPLLTGGGGSVCPTHCATSLLKKKK